MKPFLLILVLILAACQPKAHYKAENPDGSETLLDSDAQYALLEDDAELDPMKRHMRARMMVDPNKTRGNTYTTRKPPPKKAERQRTLRVARAEQKFKATKPKFIGSYDGAAAPKPPDRPLRKIMPAAGTSGGALVQDFRIGVHPDKTRLVFDLTGPSHFTYDLDNEKGYLLIRLPAASWNTDQKKVYANHPIIKGYTARQHEGEALVLVALKQAAALKDSAALTPNSVRGHRIYFDITKG